MKVSMSCTCYNTNCFSSVGCGDSETESCKHKYPQFTVKVTDLELHSVIKFLTKECTKYKEIYKRMNTVSGDSAPLYYQVKFWNDTGSLTEDDSHARHPVEASEKICQKADAMIMEDSCIKVANAHELGISAGTVSTISHMNLMLSKDQFPAGTP